MKVIEPKEIIETISNIKTGEVYKNDEEWKSKGVPEEDIRRDVDAVIQKLNTTYQQDLKDEVEAQNFFLN